jgi:AcrR family transcriptional regulator
MQSSQLPRPELTDGEDHLTLSQLVKASGVPASTIHHYRREGLIPAPNRIAANRFCYHEEHVRALALIRLLRERRGMSLEQIAAVLPEMLADAEGAPREELEGELVDMGAEARERVIEAAIDHFSTQPYAEVTMSDVAAAAGVAKGSLYRHFTSKEQLFEAVVNELVGDTASRFAAAVRGLGGSSGLADQPDEAAAVFAGLVARAMPILLELGARAAKGHDASEVMARQTLRTLAEAAGRPLSETDPIGAGLGVIERAFATVLTWAVGTDWPPDGPTNGRSNLPSPPRKVPGSARTRA